MKNNTELKQKIFSMIDQWHEETMFHSMMHAMVEPQSYKDIVALGEEAVPFIVDYLRETPCFIFLALHEITGVDPTQEKHRAPVPEAPAFIGLKVDGLIQDWINWFDKKEEGTG